MDVRIRPSPQHLQMGAQSTVITMCIQRRLTDYPRATLGRTGVVRDLCYRCEVSIYRCEVSSFRCEVSSYRCWFRKSELEPCSLAASFSSTEADDTVAPPLGRRSSISDTCRSRSASQSPSPAFALHTLAETTWNQCRMRAERAR